MRAAFCSKILWCPPDSPWPSIQIVGGGPQPLTSYFFLASRDAWKRLKTGNWKPILDHDNERVKILNKPL